MADAAHNTILASSAFTFFCPLPPLIDISSLIRATEEEADGGIDATRKIAFTWHTFKARARARCRVLETIPRPTQGGHRITKAWLLSLTDSDCLWRFRFLAKELRALLRALDIPKEFKTSHGYVFTGLEALCLLCARFRSAGDEYELTTKYDRSQTAISQVINELVVFLDEEWAHLLDFDTEGILRHKYLRQYARAIHRRGAPLKTIWGFIDCTIRRICRPFHYQRQAYNGHKKYHALKFQAIVIPNGLIAHLFGAVEGRRADPGMLNESMIMEQCAAHAYIHGDNPGERHFLQLYGDSAYGLSKHMQSPFCGPGERTPEEAEWNKMMGRVRIEVEHVFGFVVKLWPFLNTWWKMQIYRSPVGRYYRVGVLLTNAMTCLRGNQVSQAFNLRPPSLSKYFHN